VKLWEVRQKDRSLPLLLPSKMVNFLLMCKISLFFFNTFQNLKWKDAGKCVYWTNIRRNFCHTCKLLLYQRYQWQGGQRSIIVIYEFCYEGMRIPGHIVPGAPGLCRSERFPARTQTEILVLSAKHHPYIRQYVFPPSGSICLSDWLRKKCRTTTVP
jgi:hypothetical protein